ncbi:MAG: FAD-binding protein [Mailhella sp.]|nr:FAD-binding protein [Mailhella sp.]
MKIIPRPTLADRTTLRLGGTALAEIRLETPEDAEKLGDVLSETGGSPHVLGGGSNLLVRDGDLPVTVITPLLGARKSDGSPAFPEILRTEKTDGACRMLVRAGAGMPVPRLLGWCAANGCSGLEGLVGIPGRLGGAIAMNAGAYGCSTAPLIEELEIWTPEEGILHIQASDCEYSYRHFSVRKAPSWFIVLEAVMAFPARPSELIRSDMARNIAAKTASQPVKARTAGCIFKNPQGESAGRLLDAAGMKNRRIGSLFFSPMHANFLVHDTSCGTTGRTSDALELIAIARKSVSDKFGVLLETEVREWPCLP